MSTTTVCEIQAPRPTLGDLEHIARFCTDEMGLPMDVLTREIGGGDPLITLHLPAEQAASQHPVWCLACRLACFCPNARVSVLVRAKAQFAEAPAPNSRIKSAPLSASSRSLSSPPPDGQLSSKPPPKPTCPVPLLSA